MIAHNLLIQTKQQYKQYTNMQSDLVTVTTWMNVKYESSANGFTFILHDQVNSTNAKLIYEVN